MNVNQARTNMLKNQVRADKVLDDHILAHIASIPREIYVPERYQEVPFSDTYIPIGHSQVMMTPNEEARLLQALNPQPTDQVLEVGTGTGYLTALLAGLSEHVYSIDIFDDFIENARKKLLANQVKNVSLTTANAARGWNKNAPYDVIAITGSLPILPDSFRESLKPGGRLFAVIGQSPVMEAILIVRTGENAWEEKHLFETCITPLIDAPTTERFHF